MLEVHDSNSGLNQSPHLNIKFFVNNIICGKKKPNTIIKIKLIKSSYLISFYYQPLIIKITITCNKYDNPLLLAI